MPARDGNGASSGCWRRCRVGRLVAKRERERVAKEKEIRCLWVMRRKRESEGQ